jgi:hypothetical protein
MDLLQQLTNLTKDDALVVATLKSIFDRYNARLVRSLAPVRLAVASPGVQADRPARRHLPRA